MGMLGLVLQVLFAGLVIFGVTCLQLGVMHPAPGVEPLTNIEDLVVLQFAFFGIVAAVGIYRNRWWAYFLEVALLVFVVGLVMTSKLPPEEHPVASPLLVTYPHIISAIGEWYGFVLLNIRLFRSGVKGYRERKATTPNGTQSATAIP